MPKFLDNIEFYDNDGVPRKITDLEPSIREAQTEALNKIDEAGTEWVEKLGIDAFVNFKNSHNNIKNGTGDGSLQQVSYSEDLENAKNPVASGLGSIAFGGFRGDKPNEVPTEDNRTNVADGIQSAVFGCGNYTAGDWSFVSGKDNTIYSNRAFVSGGANISQAVDSEGNLLEVKTNVGRFNAIFGNNNIFKSSNEEAESNLISGGSNIVDGQRNIVGGYSNNVNGSYNEVSGQGNLAKDGASRNIIGGWRNTVTGGANLVAGDNNTINGSYNAVTGQGNKINQGDYNTIEGVNCTIYGTGSHAEGTSNVGKSGHPVNYAHAQNYNTSANAFASTTMGIGTVANYDAQTAIGEYNSSNEYSLFTVGNGSANKRSNAIEVDKNGRIYCYLTDAGKKTNWYGDILTRQEIESLVGDKLSTYIQKSKISFSNGVLTIDLS